MTQSQQKKNSEKLYNVLRHCVHLCRASRSIFDGFNLFVERIQNNLQFWACWLKQ